MSSRAPLWGTFCANTATACGAFQSVNIACQFELNEMPAFTMSKRCFRGTAINPDTILHQRVRWLSMLLLQFFNMALVFFISFFFVMFARRIFTIRFRAVNCWRLAFAIFFSGSFCNPSHHRKMSPFLNTSHEVSNILLLRLTTLLFWTCPTSNWSTRSSESWALIRVRDSNLPVWTCVQG